MMEIIHTLPQFDSEPHFVHGTCPCNPEKIIENGEDLIMVVHNAWSNVGQPWINARVDETTTQTITGEDGELIQEL